MTAVDDMAEQYDALRSRLTELKDELRVQREQVEKLTAALATCENHVKDAEHQFSAALEGRDRAQGQLDMEKARVTATNEAVNDLTDRLAEVEAEAHKAEEQQAGPSAPPGSEAAVLEAASKFGTFTAADIAYALELTDRQASARLANLETVGQVRKLGQKVMGKFLYEHIGAAQEQRMFESEGFHMVRDWVVKQKDKFTPQQLTDATEVDGQERDKALQELIRMGVISYVGFDDLELYQYVPPTDAGEAAERDRKKAKAAAKEAPRAPVAAPVAGTGGKWKISDPDVRQLVAAIEHAGGTVSPTPSGHYEVRNKENRKVMIAGTPRNPRTVRNDRARVKRILQLDI